jgi:hypothetical protein
MAKKRKKAKQKQQRSTALKARQLGDIDLYGGQARGTLVSEADPSGRPVVHAYNRSAYAHERMRKDLPKEDFEAAERFRTDFELAKHGGNYASIDASRASGGGGGDPSAACIAARQRVNRALEALGGFRNGKAYSSMPSNCVWFVVGCGDTLETWSLRQSWNGRRVNTNQAAAVLMAALQVLSGHYAGKIRRRQILALGASSQVA